MSHGNEVATRAIRVAGMLLGLFLSGCIASSAKQSVQNTPQPPQSAAVGFSTSVLPAERRLAVSGAWQFSDCCRLILPAGAVVTAGPATIDGPYSFKITLATATVTLSSSDGPVGLPVGGTRIKTQRGLAARKLITGTGTGVYFALRKERLQSELDRKAVSLTANDEAARKTVLSLAESIELVSGWMSDHSRN